MGSGLRAPAPRCSRSPPPPTPRSGSMNVTATPGSIDAGANANLTLSFDVSEPEARPQGPDDPPAPGLVGNPRAAPMCTEAGACAPTRVTRGSDVGDVSNDVTAHRARVPAGPLDGQRRPLQRRSARRRAGSLRDRARRAAVHVPILGNPLLPQIILQSAAALRPSDLGLDTVLTGLPNTATVAGLATEIDINSLSADALRACAGIAAEGFIRLPTSCKTHTVGFDAAAYDGADRHRATPSSRPRTAARCRSRPSSAPGSSGSARSTTRSS